jgi:pimeloyl-ACP methyl ester carboxylesterase
MTTGQVPGHLAGALADRYRIERELGQGGLAEVYIARATTRFLFMLAALALSSCGGSQAGQAAPQAFRAGVYRDTLHGAAARIALPHDWKGDLVIYAHGYTMPGQTPAGLGETPWEDSLRQIFLDRGFAFAESDYRTQGWAVREALEDLEQLRQHVSAAYGSVRQTYIVGHSMGGLLALATLERHPDVYRGGLALCPASAPALDLFQDPLLDLLVAFDYYFPNVIARGDSTLDHAPAADTIAIAGALRASPDRAAMLAQRFMIHRDDLPGIIWFYDVVLREIQHRTGGHPVDNRDRVYFGFDDDRAFNRGVHRYAADSSALRYLRDFYTLTGRIAAPALLVHTTYDPVIPPKVADEYATLTAIAGTQRLMVGTYVVADGHCAIGIGQTATAFERLENWVQTGQRPAAGEIR